MPVTHTVTDWITITGISAATGQVVIMPETQYVNLRGFQDFVAYCEVSNLTSSSVTKIDLQCSPTKDSTWFDNASQSANQYAANWALTSTLTAGVQGLRICRFASAVDQVPAEWLRWKVRFPSGATTNITFRIFLNALQAGWA